MSLQRQSSQIEAVERRVKSTERRKAIADRVRQIHEVKQQHVSRVRQLRQAQQVRSDGCLPPHFLPPSRPPLWSTKMDRVQGGMRLSGGDSVNNTCMTRCLNWCVPA